MHAIGPLGHAVSACSYIYMYFWWNRAGWMNRCACNGKINRQTVKNEDVQKQKFYQRLDWVWNCIHFYSQFISFVFLETWQHSRRGSGESLLIICVAHLRSLVKLVWENTSRQSSKEPWEQMRFQACRIDESKCRASGIVTLHPFWDSSCVIAVFSLFAFLGHDYICLFAQPWKSWP